MADVGANMDNQKRKRLLSFLLFALSELIESSSSDDEEELDVLINLKVGRRKKLPRLQNYVEEVIPRWKDQEFKSHFRISRDTFEFVLLIIAPKLKRKYPGLGMISPEKQFFIAIWRMATPDSYRSICEKFDPTGNAIQEVWTGFEVISSFPKVIGAIDGTHINIPSPHIHPEAYVNRKGDL
ncbi:uncharacterized protein LOC112590332 isoform X2 [Harpegnathos saltator]|uniref:uncharacterized protein LOC112590332 isoform X2 n=1 Tax=Harpegnathos saltator TaxID=610380 RepID=UPI000DBEEB3A|nr:uncharacterized protein LOC112590332 isoform X2 [Harpegnathos saltator]